LATALASGVQISPYNPTTQITASRLNFSYYRCFLCSFDESVSCQVHTTGGWK